MVRQAGSIDKLRINLNPPKADFADAQPAVWSKSRPEAQKKQVVTSLKLHLHIFTGAPGRI